MIIARAARTLVLLPLLGGRYRRMTQGKLRGAPFPEGAGIVAPPEPDEAEPSDGTAIG